MNPSYSSPPPFACLIAIIAIYAAISDVSTMNSKKKTAKKSSSEKSSLDFLKQQNDYIAKSR
jgi:hypothetical protein